MNPMTYGCTDMSRVHDDVGALRGVDLNLLVAFDAVARTGNVTAAARVVGVTQSAMSHALRRLRALFDDPLFVRSPTGVSLTPRAEALVVPVRNGLLTLSRVLSDPAAFEPATSTRTFAIASVDLFTWVGAPGIVQRLAEQAPEVGLTVRPLGSELGPQLETGQVDLLQFMAVVDEIEGLRDRYGIRNVDLNDLTAMLTKDWILELCEEVEARGLNVTLQLPSGTRSEAIDQEAAEAMFRAGVRNFTYAPESGSEEVLRRIKKRVKLPSLRRSLRGAISAGLQTHASIIIGFPGERWQDLWQSWRLSQALADDGLHTLSVMVFAPYPGSALYEELRKSGRLIEDEAWYYGALLRSAGGGRSHHDFLDARALGGIQLAMLLTFFARQYLQRPERLVSIVGNLAKGEQRNVMDQFLATKLRQLRESRS